MIAEDFGPVRVLATESIGAPDAARGTTVEGARARAQACVHRAKKPARARPAQSAIGTIIDIVVNSVKPKSFLTLTSGLVRNAG